MISAKDQQNGIAKPVLLVIGAVVIMAFLAAAFISVRKMSKPKVPPTTANTIDVNKSQTPTATIKQETQTTKSAGSTPLSTYSLTDPTSIWVIASKKYPLPKGYQPTDLIVPSVAMTTQKTGEERTLRKIIAPDLEAMFAAAKTAGISIYVSSGYRSESTQAMYYNGYVARDGVEAANRYSAKPGTSEHQTGLAMDISATNEKCHLEQCFASTPEGTWLAQNSYKYGFIIRYQDGKEPITGYQYEPWHIRYVGKVLAQIVHDKNQTLEEYFKLN
ncbi:MAG: M15 family metallopeptidase [Candidatus Saccharimonadales bacterium]